MFNALRDKLFGQGNRISRSSAKSRLQVVLVQDRTGLSTEQLGSFRKDMVTVIQKYFVIDEAGFDVSYTRDTGVTKLTINSPIVVRRDEAIGGKVGTEAITKKKAIRESAEASV